jgi:hypothetical protein
MAKPQPTKSSESIVKPLVKVEGQKNALETLIDDEQAPILKSVGYMKIFQNRQHSWVSYVVTSKGKEVISIEVSEPDMRDIAEESSKINFVQCFTDQSL